MLDANYNVFINEGTLDPGTTRVLASTPPYDHCNFTAPATVPEDRVRPFVEALLAMSSQDPEARTFMELEGVQRWLPAQVSGYAQLEESVRRFQFYGQAAAAARD